MYFKITLSLVLAIITVNNSENKFEAFKNASKNNQNQGTSDRQGSIIKTEIKKYMSECGADVSDEDDSESTYNNRNFSSYNNNNGGNNHNTRGYNNRDQSHHGNQNSNNNYRGNSENEQNYGNSYPSHDYNPDQNRNYPQTNYGNWGSSGQGTYPNPHGNMDYNRSGFGNYGSYGQYGDDSYGARYPSGRGNSKKGYYGSGSYSGGRDHFDGGYVRPKRANEDDVECISQCVFGYLEVLDDNRSPSESAMIKWLQDHLPNDNKRIKAIRDARRCFARLAAADNDDGCDFSKSLSKCLNLEIEQ